MLELAASKVAHVTAFDRPGLEPPLWWKRRITALQLFQFSLGGCGAAYYWAHYLPPAVHYFANANVPPRAWFGMASAWMPPQFAPDHVT